MKTEAHHSAGIVLFRDQDRREYLLLRSALTRRPVWEFPKGGIEEGESEREAALRELEEETGLGDGDVSIVEGFRDVERYFFTRGRGEYRRLIRKQVVYFLARWNRGEVRISYEASDFRWTTSEEAERVLRFPEKRRVLRNVEQWLEQLEQGGDAVPE